MSRYAEETQELVDLLEQWNAERWLEQASGEHRTNVSSPRRKQHHLPREYYAGEWNIFFVTLCARHQKTPFVKNDFAKEVVDALMFYRNRGDYELYAYCLMPDHLHYLLRLLGKAAESRPIAVIDGRPIPQALVAAVGRFKSYTTHQAWKHGLHGKLWQRDYYDHILRHPNAVQGITRYILTDPVRSGICREIGEYPFAGTPDLYL
jgi:REP element-mobilizing transposase RayT